MDTETKFDDGRFQPIEEYRNSVAHLDEVDRDELRRVGNFLRRNLKRQIRERRLWWLWFILGIILTIGNFVNDQVRYIVLAWYTVTILIILFFLRNERISIKTIYRFEEPSKDEVRTQTTNTKVIALIDDAYQFVKEDKNVAIGSGVDEHIEILKDNPVRIPFGKLLLLGDASDKNLLRLPALLMNFELLFESSGQKISRSKPHQEFLAQLKALSIEISNSKDLISELSIEQILKAKELTEKIHGTVGVTNAFYIVLDRKKHPNAKYSGGREIETQVGVFENFKQDFFGKTINAKNDTFEAKINWLKSN